MTTTQSDTIHMIDGHYHYPGRAAAYLIADREEAAFIDNVTRFSVPWRASKRPGLRRSRYAT